MLKKQANFKTRGMNRDLSASAFSPEFAFENLNLRISSHEGNSTMSWVNERGTAPISIVGENEDGSASAHIMLLQGTPVGMAVINHSLVLFTHSTLDYIYRLKYTDASKTQLQCLKLFSGTLGFSVEHPLETLVSYESETLQKVYWTDGINQPRYINIALHPKTARYVDTSFDFIPELQLKESVIVRKEFGDGEFPSGVIQYAFTYYNKYGQESNIFYTSPLQYISPRDRGAAPDEKVSNIFKITIKNADSHFDYVRIYSILRTSLNAIPFVRRVQDIELNQAMITDQPVEYAESPKMPEVLVDGNWLYASDEHDFEGEKMFEVEGYAIHCYAFTKVSYPDLQLRTPKGIVTWGATATHSSVMYVSSTELPTMEGSLVIFATTGEQDDAIEECYYSPYPEIHFIDTGNIGESIDPTELLYKGGESIKAYTMEQKDGTLFLGNISIDREETSNIKSTVQSGLSIYEDSRSFFPLEVSNGDYPYYSHLSSYDGNVDWVGSVPCGGFKNGDFYRLGVQFQYKTGKWSDPIYLGDKQITSYPQISNDKLVDIPCFKGYITPSLATTLQEMGYRKVRGVVVFPDIQDRVVMCQGVACPTVVTGGRGSVSEQYQSSWFFRPKILTTGSQDADGTVSPKSSGNLEYTLKTMGDADNSGYNPANIRQVEIQGEYYDYTGSEPVLGKSGFSIDEGFFTFHSPELEAKNRVSMSNYENVFLRQVALASFKKTFSDIDIQTESTPVSTLGGGFIHKSFKGDYSRGIVAGLFYEDMIVDDKKDDGFAKITGEKSPVKWMVYPWQRTGSLNNDITRPTGNSGVQSSVLKKKVLSNLRIADTRWLSSVINRTFTDHPQYFSSDYISILKLGEKIYKGNVDTLLVPECADGLYFAFGEEATSTSEGTTDLRKNEITTPFESKSWWKTWATGDEASSSNYNGTYKYIFNNNQNRAWLLRGNISLTLGDRYADLVLSKSPVRMKYKSSPHLVFTIENGLIYQASGNESVLPIVEIVRSGDNSSTRFGGISDDALRSHRWIPCGEPVRLDFLRKSSDNSMKVIFQYSYGDTYFQRWDCLKTFAYSPEDINQVVEIGSFMLESHVNTDGRYDRNRGQLNNLNMSPQNFGLINDVYSQTDNFFTYRIQDSDSYKVSHYPNQLTWTKTKQTGGEVDAWTNITLANVLELDGDKGSITSLQRLNDQLIAFQDSGVSQILYNENVQLSSTEGVPIEIANSGKVQGVRYFSSKTGCSNKWSIANTPGGIYFMDSNDKSINLFNGQFNNLSLSKGFNAWCKNSIPSGSSSWTPGFHTGDFIAHYDRLNQDVLFCNSTTALAWSEKMEAFTSFYDYGGTPFFANLDDTGIWVRGINSLWKHQAGYYNQFFGDNKPYRSVILANPDMQLDKIFTNVEFRACVEGDAVMEQGKLVPTLPFDFIEAWDEYQHGVSTLSHRNGHSAHTHDTSDGQASLKRKFRIWRCDIPRDNAPVAEEDASRGISRFKKRPLDRMRNPWIYLKLEKQAASANSYLPKTEVHDIMLDYYI